jgi:hypothetical protein
MARIGQLSNLRGSQRGAAALAKMLLVSPVLRYLDQSSGWEEDATNFLYKVKEGSLTVQARAIGGAFTSSTLTPVNNQTGSLFMHGLQIDIDQSHLADDARGLNNLAGWIDNELPEEVDSFTRLYEALLFNGSGSGSPAQIKGLKTILDGTTNMTGFSITGVINGKDAAASGDSIDLTDAANYDRFVEKLVLWISDVENPTGLLMSPRMRAKMTTIAKKQGILGQSIDQFGKPVATFNDVPMIATLATTILHTEPDDNATPVANTTSLYIMAPAEKNISLVTNSGLDFEDYEKLEAKQSGRVKGEIRAAWKIQKRNAVRRVRNIKT